MITVHGDAAGVYAEGQGGDGAERDNGARGRRNYTGEGDRGRAR